MFTDERWIAKMQGASAEIDMRFGESFVFCPTTKRPNFAAEPDGQPIMLTGVFGFRSKPVFGRDDVTKRQGGIMIESHDPVLTVSHLACPVGFRTGDVLTRCVDRTQFEVTKVSPDGVSRITLDLVQRGVARQ